MRSLDQAIKERLAEKQRAREAELSAKREQERLIAANEVEVARQAKEILSTCLDIDFSQVVTTATFSHQSANTGYYKPRFLFPSGDYIEADGNIQAPDNILNVEDLFSRNWRAVHITNQSTRDCRVTTDGDVLEAIIFALYGTTEPTQEATDA